MAGEGRIRQAQRVLLLMGATSYRAGDFLDAARRLGLEVVVGSNHRSVLEQFTPGRSLRLDFDSAGEGVAQIAAFASQWPIAAIVGVDEDTTLLAAAAGEALALAQNSVSAVTAAHDKYRFRCRLAQAGLPSPQFRLLSLDENLASAAAKAAYPSVLKPLRLSASRGVIRADGEAAFIAACGRIAAILNNQRGQEILVEAFIPGLEVALEGLLSGGELQTLALFDKPDPLDGPTFEETIYVTPSRLPAERQRAIAAMTAQAAAALGLRHGPVHAELRLNARGVWPIEIAARSIGGLCARSLSFASAISLEELILRHALGRPVDGFARETPASGVMMIPIPRAGHLRGVQGIDAAKSVSGIADVVIAVPLGDWLVPLPEGDRYLGFIFARADAPEEVEAALRQAHGKLSFDIVPKRSAGVVAQRRSE